MSAQEDVRGIVDVEPGAEPEALGDERGDVAGAGGALGLDGRDERREVGVAGCGLGQQHGEQGGGPSLRTRPRAP